MKYQLAQINIARLVAPIDDPRIAGFVNQLDKVNEMAEQSDGFVWRLKDENNNATSFNPFEDPLMIVNISVWRDAEALKAFTYGGHHLKVFLDRKKWFERMETAHMALWWIPAGDYPSAAEGKRRIELLQTKGESEEAFTFRKLFSPPMA